MIPRTPAFELPPGGTGAPAQKPQADAAREQQRRAWEREMERAQMAAWLGLGPLQAGTGTAPLAPAAPALRVASSIGVEQASAQPGPGEARWQQAAPVQDADAVRTAQAAGGFGATGSATAGEVLALPDTAPSPTAQEDVGDAVASSPGMPARDTPSAPAALPEAPSASSGPRAPADGGAPAWRPHASAQPPRDNDAAPPAGDAPAPRADAVASAREQTRQLAAQIESFGRVAATTIVAMQSPHRAPIPQGAGAMPAAAQVVGAPAVGRIPASVLAAHPDLPVGGVRNLPPALQQRIAASRSVAAEPAPPPVTTAPEAPDGAPRLDRPNSARSPAAPIRLHAQWTADGVHLWLALDAGVLPQMNQIVEQLRQWLKAQGVPLLSLVCNGQPVDLDAVPRAEIDKEAAEVSGIVSQENTVWPSVP